MMADFPLHVGPRSVANVLRDHLACWVDRDLEGDLRLNYDSHVLSVTAHRTLLGWAGARKLDEELESRRGAGALRVDTMRIGDPVSVVGWSCVQASGAAPLEGIDSFFIRRGRIFIQTRDWSATPAGPEFGQADGC